MNILNDYEENYITGWVSIFRSIQFKGWYKKSEFVHLWVHILVKANHKKNEFWFNGQNVIVDRGQFITGRKILSEETGISEGKIERILKSFENEHQIEQQKTNRNRLISVLNYDTYQLNEQQTNNKRTTSKQQADTNNNDNKENKNIPTQQEFLDYALKNGKDIDKYKLGLKYKSWVENKWKDGNGKKISNWKSKLLNTIPYLEKEKQARL